MYTLAPRCVYKRVQTRCARVCALVIVHSCVCTRVCALVCVCRMAFFAKLALYLEDHDVQLALEESIRLAKTEYSACCRSSEYLLLAARVCSLTRQWGLCQILSRKALIVNNWHFASLHMQNLALTLFAYTSIYDLMCRSDACNTDMWEEVLLLFSLFPPNEAEYRPALLMKLTEHRPLPRNVWEILQHELDLITSPIVSVSRWGIKERVKKLEAVEVDDWVVQIDAGEIGNEARYCNHADMPTAVLLNDESPRIVALCDIEIGDEITINYGASYWSSTGPGSDPLLLDCVITEPFTDCIYYDGVIEDFGCLGFPGGFLVPPNGKKSQRNRKISVKQVPVDHPAYPGFGVYANSPFAKFDQICIYGGIIDMSPFSRRHASRYTVDISSGNAMGPFGFVIDPKTLECSSVQKFLPFLTEFNEYSNSHVYEKARMNNLLESVKTINEVGEPVTRTICKALLIPEYRNVLKEKLVQIPIPFNNPNKKDSQGWARLVRKTFEDILTRPPQKNSMQLFFSL